MQIENEYTAESELTNYYGLKDELEFVLQELESSSD